MKHLAQACIAATLVSIPCAAAAGNEDRPALGTGVFLSGDSEDFTTRRITVDYRFGSADNAFNPGIRIRQHDFSQGAWDRTARQLLLTGSGTLAPEGSNWQAEIGVLDQGGRQLLTMDAAAHLALSKSASAEAFLNRDYVETAAALDQGVHATFAGASIEYAFHPKLTGVALLGRQTFSDGNDRNHGRLRLIFQPDLDLGLTLQLRYRYYTGDATEIRRAYFNPERYSERMVLAGWRTRGDGWTGSLLAGIGRQDVGDGVRSPTRLLETSLEKSLGNDQSFSMRAGYNQSASFGGPDYRYRYLQANWSLKF